MSTHVELKVSPSILAANALDLGRDVQDVEANGADWHHVDVMDGHFVPNLTYGPPMVRALKEVSKIPLDVHIMVTNPDDVAVKYTDAGADILTFHIEAAKKPRALAKFIRDQGCMAGIAISPETSLSLLDPLLSEVDLVNIMSVKPGFGGQSFMPETVDRVRSLRATIDGLKLNHHVYIEVDGGINAETGRKVVEAGADVLVAGTYVYGSSNRKIQIQSLRSRN